jgi:hypothetical protein
VGRGLSSLVAIVVVVTTVDIIVAVAVVVVVIIIVVIIAKCRTVPLIEKNNQTNQRTNYLAGGLGHYYVQLLLDVV